MIGFASGGTRVCGNPKANWLNTIIEVDEVFEHTAANVLV
jgi:hypothetical protein